MPSRTRRTSKHVLWGLIAICVLFALASCSGGSDSSSDSGTETTTGTDGDAVDDGDAGADTDSGDASANNENADGDTTSGDTASADGTTISVAWWGEGDQNTRTQQALDAFTAESGAATEPQATNFAGYFERLATQVAGNNAPDVFQLSMPTLAEYADQGALYDLTEYYGSTIDTTGWADVAIQSAQYQGSDYFVPLGLATHAAIIVDQTVLDELGMDPIDPDWDLDQFRAYSADVAARLTESRGETSYGTNDFGGQPIIFESYVASLGKSLFTPEGELGFGEQELTDWLTYWEELRNEGTAVPVSAQEGGGFEASPLIRGIAPIGHAYASKGIQGYMALTDDELGFVPFPKANADAQRVALTGPVELMAASADTQSPAEAAALMNFLANDAASFKAMGIAKGAPVSEQLRKEMMDSGELTDVEMLIYQNVEDNLPYATPRNVYPPGSSEILGVAGSLLSSLNEQIGAGQISVDEAVQRFFSDAERALN